MLPARWERLSEIAPLLRDLLPAGPAVAAIRDGKLVGFMMAMIIPSFLGQPTAYSPEWANGATYVEPGRVYEEMYARLAIQWAASGCRLHAVSLMALDAATTAAWPVPHGERSPSASANTVTLRRCASPWGGPVKMVP